MSIASPSVVILMIVFATATHILFRVWRSVLIWTLLKPYLISKRNRNIVPSKNEKVNFICIKPLNYHLSSFSAQSASQLCYLFILFQIKVLASGFTKYRLWSLRYTRSCFSLKSKYSNEIFLLFSIAELISLIA